MLSNYEVLAKETDPNKQYSLMRNYLWQLKDEIESELMNIGYGNLSKDLRDYLDSLGESVNANGDNTNRVAQTLKTDYIKTQSIEAKYITAEQISAQYVKTVNLEAAVIQAGFIKAATVEAQYVKTVNLRAEVISAGFIDADAIESVYLKTNNLSAAAIEAGFIKANTIEATYLKSASLTSTLITSKFTSANTALFERINAKEYHASNESGTSTLRLGWHSVVSGGVTLYFLATTTNPAL